jgi:hypothetical protein
MNNDFDDLINTDLLCPICLERYKARLAKAKAKLKKIVIHTDIHSMLRNRQVEETNIFKSLSLEEWNKYYALVKSVENWAEIESNKEESTYNYYGETGEQDILYNILIAATWRAAIKYDPANPKKAKFSTYVKTFWKNEISRFRKVKRRSEKSLHAPTSTDSDNSMTLEDVLKNENSPSPEDYVIFDKETAWGDTTLNSRLLKKMMIDNWFCPFCARTIKSLFRKEQFTAENQLALPQIFGQDVYTRRRLLLN